MVPSLATHDYYAILGVDRSATLPAIVQSYRRLARKLHPDKNNGAGATVAFQTLAQAYETLKDPATRKAYDRTYRATFRERVQSESNDCPGTNGTPDEAAQIQNIRTRRSKRAAQWSSERESAESLISISREAKSRLEVDLAILTDVAAAAEATAQAERDSWAYWISSRFTKSSQQSEAQAEDMEMKRLSAERRLEIERKALRESEELLASKAAEFRAANQQDEEEIAALTGKMSRRKEMERTGEERAAKERETALRVRQQQAAVRHAHEASQAYFRQLTEIWAQQRQKRSRRERRTRQCGWQRNDRQPTCYSYGYSSGDEEADEEWIVGSRCGSGESR